ncbi:MAG: hypothetical protein V1796_03060 [Pseudomonadota bacterium]
MRKRGHLILIDIMMPGMDGYEVARVSFYTVELALAGVPVLAGWWLTSRL